MLRDLILTRSDNEAKPVEVPEWGVTLYVRKFDGHEAARIRSILKDRPDDADARVVALVALDDQGNKVFTDQDVELLHQKRADVVGRIVRAAFSHNGLDLGDDEAKKA